MMLFLFIRGECHHSSGSYISSRHLVRLLRLHAATQAENQVHRRARLDVVGSQRAAKLELLACVDQALLIERDSRFVQDLGFHVGDVHAAERDGLA